MGIEMVHDQHDALGVGIAHVHELLDLLCPVAPGPPRGDVDPAPTGQRLTAEKEIDDALAFVLVVDAGWPPWRRWLPSPRVTQQLLGGFVEADQWTARVVGAGVDLEDVFHAPDEVPTGLRRDAPLPPQVRLERVFFSIRRTVW